MLVGEFVPDCVRSNLRGSKFTIFLGGVCPQTPLIGTHTYTCVSVLPHVTIILLYHCVFPLQLKILYENLHSHMYIMHLSVFCVVHCEFTYGDLTQPQANTPYQTWMDCGL